MIATKHTALITPSYRGDFESCRLLCDSIDQFVTDRPHHYILVENDDHKQFFSLSGPRRHVINELDILPSWLKTVQQGFSATSRKIWYSTRTWPMRGWHVQQLRRIAIAAHVPEDALLYCDSDMLFIKPFETLSLWKGDDLRLYRKDGGISDDLPDGGQLHKDWTSHAAYLNGLPAPTFPAGDYINNLVSWRRDLVNAMCRHIEEVSGKHWLAAIGSKRSFSECQIYGSYVDGVLGGEGHFPGNGSLCKTYWDGDALTKETLAGFTRSMSPEQVAIGVQSFTGTSPDVLRDLLAA